MDQKPEPNAIPVETIDIDKLPTEQGFTYDEIAKIVGSLYLDSHHRFNTMENQFRAIVAEHRQQAEYIRDTVTAQNQELQKEIDRLNAENLRLKQELERRNERRPSSAASGDSG